MRCPAFLCNYTIAAAEVHPSTHAMSALRKHVCNLHHLLEGFEACAGGELAGALAEGSRPWTLTGGGAAARASAAAAPSAEWRSSSEALAAWSLPNWRQGVGMVSCSVCLPGRRDACAEQDKLVTAQTRTLPPRVPPPPEHPHAPVLHPTWRLPARGLRRRTDRAVTSKLALTMTAASGPAAAPSSG